MTVNQFQIMNQTDLMHFLQLRYNAFYVPFFSSSNDSDVIKVAPRKPSPLTCVSPQIRCMHLFYQINKITAAS